MITYQKSKPYTKSAERKSMVFFHTAFNDKKANNGKRQGKEILFFSDSLKEPNLETEDWNPTQFKFSEGRPVYKESKKVPLFTK